MGSQQSDTGPHASSTGQMMTGADWLDAHFEAVRAEYTAMLGWVGLAPGWHVLDAGCGAGSFLPLIAEAVGASGRITALDLAPNNIATVGRRVTFWGLPCPIATEVGSLLSLPFPDERFDAIWCANTTMYLSDEELLAALGEFHRVVRPGGIVALKDPESGHYIYEPSPAPFSHLAEALAAVARPVRGTFRSHLLRRWLERAGFEAVWQRTGLIERWSPLRPVERQHVADFLVANARMAAELDLPEAEKAFWRTQCDAESPQHLINHPDFYYCVGDVVAVGRAPRGAAR